MVLKILEFQVNHLLPAVLSRLRNQIVTVRDKLISFLRLNLQFFLIALQHNLRNIFLVYKPTSMPTAESCNPSSIAQDEKQKN